MKKIKLLTSLSTVGALGGGVASIATSCTWTYKKDDDKKEGKIDAYFLGLIPMGDSTKVGLSGRSFFPNVVFKLEDETATDVKWSVSPEGSEETYLIDETTGTLSANRTWAPSSDIDLTITATYNTSKEAHYNITLVQGSAGMLEYGEPNPGKRNGYEWWLFQSELSNDGTFTHVKPDDFDTGKWYCCTGNDNGSELYSLVGSDYGSSGVLSHTKFNNGVLTLKANTTAADIENIAFLFLYTDFITIKWAPLSITINT